MTHRRYSRHLLMPEVGLEGQQRLLAARALCVGAGGLGAPVLSYLAAAGVGRIGIVDDDVVDETNLQRQTLFSTADIGRPKVAVAAERLMAMNPQVAVDAYPIRLDASNARDLVRPYDVVLDCTDRFLSRYHINDACVLEGKPDVYGSLFRFDAQVTVFNLDGGPCYRCLFPLPPPLETVPTCAEGGVLGVLAGIAGAFQGNEALKAILRIGEPLSGRLLLIEALRGVTREVRFTRDLACAICGPRRSITEVRDVQLEEPPHSGVPEIEPECLEEALAAATLLDVREPHEAVLGTVEGSLHIPSSQLLARMHELDTAQTYVVACRLGQQSQWAIRRLQDAGFRRLLHLRGGLLAYAAHNAQLAIF